MFWYSAWPRSVQIRFLVDELNVAFQVIPMTSRSEMMRQVRDMIVTVKTGVSVSGRDLYELPADVHIQLQRGQKVTSVSTGGGMYYSPELRGVGQ